MSRPVRTAAVAAGRPPYGSPTSSSTSSSAPSPPVTFGDIGPSASTRAILSPQEGVVVKGDMAIIAICKHLNGMPGSKGGFILRELDDNTLFCKASVSYEFTSNAVSLDTFDSSTTSKVQKVQDWLRLDVSKELSKLLSLGEDSQADGHSPDDWVLGGTPPDSSVDGGSSSRRTAPKKRGRRPGGGTSVTSKRTKKW